MSFSPIIVGGGYNGWRMLSRTLDRQMEALSQSAELRRDDAYFKSKIAKVSTAEDLVSDRRLLKVALEAFGLGNDLNNRAFIRKILEDGTLDRGALANKLADKRYADFSRAFGFDLKIPRTRMSDFADKILGAYKERKFESAVGEVSESMQLGLNAQRELRKIAGSNDSATTKWYKILGAPPVRKVIETVFSLPSSFAAIDLDQQIGVVKDKAQAMFGSSDPAIFRSDENLEKAIRLFTIRSEISASSGASRFSIALTLLNS